MEFMALIPFRTLGFFCLLFGLGAMPTVLVGLGPSSATVATAWAILGICLLWIGPAVLSPKGRYRTFRKTLAIVRSVVIFGCFAFVVSGYFGGSEVGTKLAQSISRFEFDEWWAIAITVTLVVLVIDLGLGALQVAIPKLERQA